MTKCFSYSPNLSGSWKIKNNARGIFLQNDNIINFDNKQNNKLIIKRPLFLGINHDFIHGTYKINNFDKTINFNFQNITEEYKYNFDDMTKELCLFDNSKFPHMLLNLDKPKIYLIKNNLKNLNESLETFLKNYFDKNKIYYEDEDFEQISKILKYTVDNKIVFNKLKPNIFTKIFIADINNMKNYYDIYNFLYYFNFNKIKEEKLLVTLSEDSIWERLIENMHLMNLDQLINLSQIMKNYEVKYFRIWIFIQNFFRVHVKNWLLSSEENLSNTNFNGNELVNKIENILNIFKDEKFKYEDFVLFPFIVMLETTRDKLVIQNSYRIKNI